MNDLAHLVDADTERVVIATIIRGGNAAYSDVEFLRSDDFANQANRTLFDIVQELAPEVDPKIAAVSRRVMELGKLDAIGGFDALMDIERLAIPELLKALAEDLRAKAIKRRAWRLNAKFAMLLERGASIGSAEIQEVIEDLRLLELPKDSPEPGKLARIEDVPELEEISTGNVEWLVDGIAAEGAMHLITGEAGAGKSSVVSALGYAVSRGDEFLGRATTQRPVLILDAENPAPAVGAIPAAWYLHRSQFSSMGPMGRRRSSICGRPYRSRLGVQM